MNGIDRDELLNRLLDGDLDQAQLDALEAEVTRDEDLARALHEARQLKAALAGLPGRSVPADLAERLREIPETYPVGPPASRLGHHRWLAAAAAVVVVAAVATGWQVSSSLQEARLEAQQIAQARQDLDVAFGYLAKVSSRAGGHINESVGGGLSAPFSGISIRLLDWNSQEDGT